jgi:membrane protease YdiL (CAAX protease family)
MEHITTLREWLGALLRTNKLAILAELVIVLAPTCTGMILGPRSGRDFVPLGGSVVLLGAPLAYLGGLLGFGLVWISLWLRGVCWYELGLRRPRSWVLAILTSVGMAVVITLLLIVLTEILIRTFPNGAPPDESRFAPLHGHLPNLLINVVAVWFTAGFIEEMMWRGYLMNRVVDLVGSTTLAWSIALIGSAAIFGIIHAYQGPLGILRTGVAGLLFGIAYLIVGRRNLWILIIAHALIDTVSFVFLFLNVN